MLKALRLLPLYLGVGLTGATAIISIPIMISAASLSEWAAIAAGQSVGAMAASGISYGWGITGASEIARAAPLQRVIDYRNSVVVRSILTPIALTVSGCLLIPVVPSEFITSALLGLLSTALPGLSAYFYLVGVGDYWKAFLLDSLPRVIGGMLPLAFLALDPSISIAIVPIGMSAGAVAAFLLGSCFALRGHVPRSLPPVSIRGVLVARRHSVWTSLATSVSQAAPVLIVGYVVPSALSVFVFYDRLFKQGMTLLSPLLNALQGSIPRAQTDAERMIRVRNAVLGLIAGSLLLLVILAFAGPFVVELLSGDKVPANLHFVLVLGLLIGLSSIDIVVSRTGLVITEQQRYMSSGAITGLMLSLTACGVLSLTVGPFGALVGLLLGVAVRLAVSTFALHRYNRRAS